MLDTITRSALPLLSCELAWLLIYEDEILATGALASTDEALASTFLPAIATYYRDGMLPVKHRDNPLAEVLLRNMPLVGLEIEKLATISGGEPLTLVFGSLGMKYITLVPLRHADYFMGVLVFASTTNAAMSSEQGQQIIKLLRREAMLELEHLELEQRLEISQSELQAERNLFHVVLDTIGDGLLMADSSGIIIYVSQRLLVMTGYTSQELLGQPLEILFHNSNLQEILNRHSTISTTQSLKTKVSQIVPVLMSHVITRDITNDDETTVIVLSDISNLLAHEQALERQTQRLEIINRALQAFSVALSFYDVSREIVPYACEISHAKVGFVAFYDAKKNLNIAHLQGVSISAAQPIQSGIAAWVAHNAQPILVSDAQYDKRFDTHIDSFAECVTRSIMAVPLIAAKEVIGVLAVFSDTREAFTTEDLDNLGNLATAAGIALENARLFDQTQQRLSELSTLLDSSAAAVASKDIRVVLERVARRLREALDIERLYIGTYNRRVKQFAKLVEVVDAEWSLEQAPVQSISNYPAKSNALLQNQPTMALINNLIQGDHSELQTRGMRSVLNVPLSRKKQVIGLISVYGHELFTTTQATAVEKIIDGWRDWDNWTLLCQRVLQETASQWCTIYSWNQSNIHLIREIGTGVWTRQVHFDLETHTTLSKVFETGNVQVVELSEIKNAAEQAHYMQLGVHNVMVVPIPMQGQVAGIITLMASAPHDFTHQTVLSLSQGVANIAGNALENAALYSSLEKRAEALEKAYREIEDNDRLKHELLQNLSHELGTPLTHILGYLSLLEDNTFGDLSAEQLKTIRLILDKTQHIADLVRQMVAVHSSNAQSLSMKETKLDQLAALAIRSMTPRAHTAGIKINATLPNDLPEVQVDQVAMSEVFEALLDNAIKFSRNGKRIEVGIRDNGLALLVSVRDEGIGIPKDEHEKIFKQFYQVDSGLTRQFEGMGLGLAIVKKVVTAHGGRVWVESEVGKGTTVFFTVPKAGLDPISAIDDQSMFAFQ